MTDPYSVLGVTRDASDEEITRAYRVLARKFHPDLNPGNKHAETNMKNLNAAYMQIQDTRSGKSYRQTEGWGGMGDTQTDDARSGSSRQNSNYGRYYNPYGGFYDGGYNNNRSGSQNNGRVFYTFNRGRSYGLFGFPFIRIILAIIVLRFVLGIIVTLLAGPVGYNDYPKRRESYNTAQINVNPDAQSGAEDWLVL